MISTILLFFLALIPNANSMGILHIEVTSNRSCILQTSHFITTSVELSAYQPRLQTFHSTITSRFFEVGLGVDSGNLQFHNFNIQNNGKVEEVVMNFSNSTTLFVRSSFNCSQGFFGDRCQHKSRILTTKISEVSTKTTIITTTTTEIVSSSTTTSAMMIPEASSEGNYDRYIIYILLVIILFLTIVIIYITCLRHFSLFGNRNNETRRSNTTMSISDFSCPPTYTSTPYKSSGLVSPQDFTFCTPPTTPESSV